MTIGSILLALALLVVVGLYLARPLILDQRSSPQSAPATREQLIARKETLLAEIRALDFDRDTGKIPEEVHAQQRADLVAQTAAVMQQIDALGTTDDATLAAIETAVAQLRQQHPAAVKPADGQTTFCTSCGQPHDPDDNFCAYCGQPVRTTQPA